ncbi:MAG: hypothetical protein RTU92_06335 [Candidatus Thorarchaeota archaeon]
MSMKRILVVMSLVVFALLIPVDGILTDQYSTPKQVDDFGIWLSEVSIFEVNNGTDLYVDIYYNYSFDGSERIVQEMLFLSLDNDTFIRAINRLYDPELMPANGTNGFFFAHSVGDPLPFDVLAGQILSGYIEVVSTESTYRTQTFSKEIPIDVLRSFLFRIPSWLLLVGGIAASVLPIALCGYLVIRTTRKSKNQQQ